MPIHGCGLTNTIRSNPTLAVLVLRAKGPIYTSLGQRPRFRIPPIFEGGKPDPLGIGPRTKCWREIETGASCSPPKSNPSNQGKWFKSVQGISEPLQTPLFKSHPVRTISSNLVGTTCRFELDILQNPGKNINPGPKKDKKIVKNHSNCVTWANNSPLWRGGRRSLTGWCLLNPNLWNQSCPLQEPPRPCGHPSPEGNKH